MIVAEEGPWWCVFFITINLCFADVVEVRSLMGGGRRMMVSGCNQFVICKCALAM
jgi:hypothetical protein